MLLQVILEGLGLGVLLVLICAAGIRKGAVGMVHLYSPAVQQRCVKLGLTSPERIRRNSLLFKAVCIPGYIGYVLVCVYGINGAPPKTKLLELARENGFQAYNGIGMLLYQGVEAFRIWTGCEFPLEYVEQQNLFANDLNP